MTALQSLTTSAFRRTRDALFPRVTVLGCGMGKRYRSPKAPPVDGQRILQVGDPDLALVGRQLWGRRDKYDNPHDPYYLPADRRSISEKPCAGLAPWQAVPQS